MDKIHTQDEERPWGKFEVFAKNEPTTVKIITIKKGGECSLQYHNQRAEFWRVLSGTPDIRIGDVTTRAKKGDEFRVPIGALHRFSAPDNGVEILEIGFGTFDEQGDIVRLEDKYGRT